MLSSHSLAQSLAHKCTDVPQFDALEAAAALFRSDDKLHLRNLCNDSARCAGLTANHICDAGRRRILLDYSRQQVTGETMELLFSLADAVGFTDKREAMRTGIPINSTEGRPVLHHLLRMPRDYFYSDQQQLSSSSFHTGSDSSFTSPLAAMATPTAAMPFSAANYSSTTTTTATAATSTASAMTHDNIDQLLESVHKIRDKIQDFSNKVRSGIWRGCTGKPLRNYLCIGIGGSNLGNEYVYEALKSDPRAEIRAQGRTLRFLTNVDPSDFHRCVRDLHPEETLVIIISKTFTTSESMLNARTVRNWLFQSLLPHTTETQVIAKHMIAVTCNPPLCQNFRIPAPTNIFGFWDWVGGRFSVCSAVGLLPLSLYYSYDIMCEVLAGAHDIDDHFFNAPLRDNIPLILGLLGVWNSTFMNYTTRALLPYSQALHRFPAYIRQVEMESNGKRVASDGTPLLHESGEILFGESGTNAQHSFFQLMHQGRTIPADFIGFMEPQQPVEIPGEAVSNHDELMSNFFAQPDALAYGKTLVDLVQEGVHEPLREHMVFSGNRPSSSILITRLDPFSVGQLLALYEHRTVVQGFIWGINSFDQFGVELGKQMAKHVRAQLSASRKTGASVQGFNSSTSSLLEAYLAHEKQ